VQNRQVLEVSLTLWMREKYGKRVEGAGTLGLRKGRMLMETWEVSGACEEPSTEIKKQSRPPFGRNLDLQRRMEGVIIRLYGKYNQHGNNEKMDERNQAHGFLESHGKET